MSHETWQLVNSLECFLPYTVLIYKNILQFILFKKIFYFCYFLLFSLVSNSLTNGSRHFKLFTNCHVSWDTLYLKPANIWCIYSKQILKIKRNTSRLQILYKNYVNNEENGHFNSLRLFCYKYLRFLTTHHSSNFHFFQTNVVGLGYLKLWSFNQRF